MSGIQDWIDNEVKTNEMRPPAGTKRLKMRKLGPLLKAPPGSLPD